MKLKTIKYKQNKEIEENIPEDEESEKILPKIDKTNKKKKIKIKLRKSNSINSKEKIFFLVKVLSILIFLILVHKLYHNIKKIKIKQQNFFEKFEKSIEQEINNLSSNEAKLKNGQNEANLKIEEIRKKDFIKYIKICEKGLYLDSQHNYGINENPKISIIIAIYNAYNYIIRILRSIQNQTFKDLEIIFINDASTDKSKEIILLEMKNDKRIKLIENEKNKGTLYSRRKGVLNSKGEYICFIDQDDVLINDILINAYKIAKSKNIDILNFQYIEGWFENFSKQAKHTTSIIKQPELKYYPYIYKKYIFRLFMNPYVWSKIIKRNVLIKSYNNINETYFDQNICFHEDTFLTYMFFRNANNYTGYNQFGYFNLFHKNRTSSDKYGKRKSNYLIKDTLLLMKMAYENSENTEKDKNFAAEVGIMHLGWIADRQKHKFTLYRDLATYIKNLYTSDKYINKNRKNKIANIIDRLLGFNKL